MSWVWWCVPQDTLRRKVIDIRDDREKRLVLLSKRYENLVRDTRRLGRHGLGIEVLVQEVMQTKAQIRLTLMTIKHAQMLITKQDMQESISDARQTHEVINAIAPHMNNRAAVVDLNDLWSAMEGGFEDLRDTTADMVSEIQQLSGQTELTLDENVRRELDIIFGTTSTPEEEEEKDKHDETHEVLDENDDETHSLLSTRGKEQREQVSLVRLRETRVPQTSDVYSSEDEPLVMNPERRHALMELYD
jgi:hypothetical protein